MKGAEVPTIRPGTPARSGGSGVLDQPPGDSPVRVRWHHIALGDGSSGARLGRDLPDPALWAPLTGASGRTDRLPDFRRHGLALSRACEWRPSTRLGTPVLDRCSPVTQDNLAPAKLTYLFRSTRSPAAEHRSGTNPGRLRPGFVLPSKSTAPRTTQMKLHWRNSGGLPGCCG